MFGGYASDPEVTRYLTWPAHPTVESITEYLRAANNDWEVGTSFRYELCVRGGEDSVGSVRLRPEKTGTVLSYVLARPYWGRGLMTEALQYAVEWALAQPEVFRAYAFCDLENLGSIRVMEKAGMSREGILRRWHVCPNIGPEPRDCLVYAKVR
jgi:RimJ/RimL family protein N-acetyltransferase